MSIFKTKPLPAAAPEPSKAVAGLEATKQIVESMAAKLETARRHAENLASERARVALAAHTGDEPSRKRLDEINAEISVHTSEVASVEAALSEARNNVIAAEAGVAGEDQARRQAEARRISDLILAEAERFDQAANAMVAALRRRRELHRELAGTGVYPVAITNRLHAPMGVNRALAAAGIGDFAEFDRGGSSALMASLTDHDAKFIGRPESPAKAAA